MSGSGWVQQNGRWVKTGGAPPVPPRPGVAPAVPVRPAAMASGLNKEFLANPLQFMQKHVVSPANGSVAGAASTVEWALDPADIIMDLDRGAFEGATYRRDPLSGEKIAVGQRLNVGTTIKFMVLQAANATYQGKVRNGRLGEVLPVLADSAQEHSQYAIPIYWLPWSSLKIAETSIPEVPADLYDPPEDLYPRFFFTAGVNGCSVFARGNASSPTIFHAGLADKLTRGSAAFWRDQMAKAQTGISTAAIKGEVHKDEYMLNDPRERALAEEYAAWLNQDQNDTRPFTIDVATGFGCIFGIRYGRHWTLYLQTNLVMNKVKFYKRSELTPLDVPGLYKHPALSSAIQRSVTTTPRQVGPFTLGTKRVKTYKSGESFVRPMKLIEFYPNRHWSSNFKSVVARGVG